MGIGEPLRALAYAAMTPDAYRKKAAEIRKRADQIQEPTLRKEWLTLAQQYKPLADAVEKPRRHR